MTDKEKTIKELKEVLDSLDITNKYRLNLIRAIEYLQKEPVSIWNDVSEKSNEPEEVDNPCKIRKNLQKDIVIVLNGQRHRQVLHKGCFSKKECKEKCSLYERCQRCCIDLCMIFFHDPHCHFEVEPVSEDLEKEIINYIGFPQEIDEDISTTMIRKAARHFANWQKEQMEKEYSDLNKGLVSAKGVAVYMAYETGKKDLIGKVRSILNKVAYRNNGLDVNGDYCEQPYAELDTEFKKLLKED